VERAHGAAVDEPARPAAVAWNHDVVMRQGAEGLVRLLGARMLVRS
jgi:hypothetical protein